MKRVDYLRVSPGLNDIGDALEAIPAEMVRHLTLLKEIDAKCINVAPTLSGEISEFMAPGSTDREAKLKKIIQLLKELMPCIEEKMHVASMAAETMARHVSRIDTDFQLIVDHEIPKEIQVNPKDPALRENLVEVKPTGTATRTEVAPGTRRRGRRPQIATPEPPSPVIVNHPPPKVEYELVRRTAPASEQPYCYCDKNGTGEMVGCDGPECSREWFHLGCIGLTSAPKGQWFCEECRAKLRAR